jgi:Flp pilus assembly pilin Flp
MFSRLRRFLIDFSSDEAGLTSGECAFLLAALVAVMIIAVIVCGEWGNVVMSSGGAHRL